MKLGNLTQSVDILWVDILEKKKKKIFGLHLVKAVILWEIVLWVDIFKFLRHFENLQIYKLNYMRRNISFGGKAFFEKIFV